MLNTNNRFYCKRKRKKLLNLPDTTGKRIPAQIAKSLPKDQQ